MSAQPPPSSASSGGRASSASSFYRLSMANLLNAEETTEENQPSDDFLHHSPPAEASTSTKVPVGQRTRCYKRRRTHLFLQAHEREEILERIHKGEKQADLAKAYNVSRAAITNLKKRRARQPPSQATKAKETKCHKPMELLLSRLMERQTRAPI